jgi:hypothetical protein
VGVGWELLSKEVEDVGRQQLPLARVRIRPGSDVRCRQIKRRADYHRHHEKCLGKFL